MSVTPSRSERFLSLVRGERRGIGASLARAALWWARLPYGIGVRIRNCLFDRGWKRSERVAIPVVSVGNLTLGGTGKTPCVECLAQYYRELGLQVAILSRGYGADHGPNDEAMVLEENLPDVPHLQGVNRVDLARTAEEELESELLILDDGFQHRRLARDLDVVLIDATRPLRSDYLFPRGTLREPIGSLQRAGAIVVTRVDQASSQVVTRLRSWLHERFPNATYAEAIHAPMELLSTAGSVEIGELRERETAAFCGLGNPAAFQQTVRDLGGRIIATRTFPDHHAYTREDVDSLRAWAETLPRDTLLVTSQKDFVKLRIAELAGRPLRAVRIGMKFVAGEDEFRERLRRIGETAFPRSAD